MGRVEEVIRTAVARRNLELRAAGDELLYGEAFAMFAFCFEIRILIAIGAWKDLGGIIKGLGESQIGARIRLAQYRLLGGLRGYLKVSWHFIGESRRTQDGHRHNPKQLGS
jgi:hypothetical protein